MLYLRPVHGLMAKKGGTGDAGLKKQWIIRTRFTAELFLKQFLLRSYDLRAPSESFALGRDMLLRESAR
jgi:hypothetical protein